jgi:hypothetical protein
LIESPHLGGLFVFILHWFETVSIGLDLSLDNPGRNQTIWFEVWPKMA